MVYIVHGLKQIADSTNTAHRVKLVQAATLWIRIPEVPISNLGLNTDYPEEYDVFFRTYRQMPGQYLEFGKGLIVLNYFLFVSHYQSIIRCYIAWFTDGVIG
jgi:hypothetical protein